MKIDVWTKITNLWLAYVIWWIAVLQFNYSGNINWLNSWMSDWINMLVDMSIAVCLSECLA